MCKILKAEMWDKDLHIVCGDDTTTPPTIHEEAVYGTDKVFNFEAAIVAFKSRHRAEDERKKPVITVLEAVIGEVM